jgi:CheY-like chemotaxis protein
VAETIRHHGGQVQIESEVGTGTTVWMFLPRDTTDESRNITIDIPTSLAAETGRLRAHGRKARILLVDDNVEVRNSLGRLLRQQGHDVVGAANGQEAIELYRQERPDLVLLDVDMPLVTGPEAYQQIRAGDPTANVIFMSGQWETVGSLLRGSDSARPPAFLRKPIAAKDLARAVRSALES